MRTCNSLSNVWLIQICSRPLEEEEASLNPVGGRGLAVLVCLQVGLKRRVIRGEKQNV